MRTILIFLPLLVCSITFAQIEKCDQIIKECEKLLNVDTKSTFVSDGQLYAAFLDGEKAEFNTTLFEGTLYRIAASAGSDENYVIYTVKDPDGNILFSNRNYKNAPYWNFNVLETIPISVEVELDKDFKSSGCVIMMIGFQK